MPGGIGTGRLILLVGDDLTEVGVGGRRIDMFVAEFFGFFEALVLKGNGANFAQETKFAETDGTIGEGFIFNATDNGQSDGQIDAGLIDIQATGNIDENVSGSQRELEVFGENGADELKPVGVDTFGDPPGNGNGAVNDQGLDLGGHGTGALHNQGENRSRSGFEATFEKKF